MLRKSWVCPLIPYFLPQNFKHYNWITHTLSDTRVQVHKFMLYEYIRYDIERDRKFSCTCTVTLISACTYMQCYFGLRLRFRYIKIVHSSSGTYYCYFSTFLHITHSSYYNKRTNRIFFLSRMHTVCTSKHTRHYHNYRRSMFSIKKWILKQYVMIKYLFSSCFAEKRHEARRTASGLSKLCVHKLFFYFCCVISSVTPGFHCQIVEYEILVLYIQKVLYCPISSIPELHDNFQSELSEQMLFCCVITTYFMNVGKIGPKKEEEWKGGWNQNKSVTLEKWETFA